GRGGARAASPAVGLDPGRDPPAPGREPRLRPRRDPRAPGRRPAGGLRPVPRRGSLPDVPPAGPALPARAGRGAPLGPDSPPRPPPDPGAGGPPSALPPGPPLFRLAPIRYFRADST